MSIGTILASKKKMSQVWDKSGQRLSVTIMTAGPCVVTQVKRPEVDGYWALQLGWGQRRKKTVSQPFLGQVRKISGKDKLVPRLLREVKLDKESEFKVGDKIRVEEVLQPGDVVNVTGVTKGRGFAGVIKRWGFKGGPRTHGQSDRERAPGSIGQGTDPGRVHKGKKMPGRYGNATVTIKNLLVVKVVPEKNEVWVKGLVPGAKGNLVMVKKMGESKFEGLVEEVQKEGTEKSKSKGAIK